MADCSRAEVDAISTIREGGLAPRPERGPAMPRALPGVKGEDLLSGDSLCPGMDPVDRERFPAVAVPAVV